jgi:hypothetical protein
MYRMTAPPSRPYRRAVRPYPSRSVTMGVSAMLMIMATSWKACRMALVLARTVSSGNSSGNSAA